MTSVSEHYANHLAPIYLWMAGGTEAALTRGRTEIATLVTPTTQSLWAVDLGAGFGMHAIPLAELGYSVLALDTSPLLLAQLQATGSTQTIVTVAADLLAFKQYLQAPPSVVLCMGDTLTHLPDRAAVAQLFAQVASALAAGGQFIMTFRDYSVPLTGTQRFIPVRSDADRILTCFLEYADEVVTVHDIVHERDGLHWRQSISAYPKLRLAPEWVMQTLADVGLQVQREQGLAGMIRLIARRQP